MARHSSGRGGGSAEENASLAGLGTQREQSGSQPLGFLLTTEAKSSRFRRSTKPGTPVHLLMLILRPVNSETLL